MKTILCFGDSNTWGFIPASEAERYPHDVRWPGVMEEELGKNFRVIEEAQNGRTTVLDDPYELTCKNGRRALPIALQSHAPLDLVIIMLGTNDLKHYFKRDPEDVAEGVALLADIALASESGWKKASPKVLLVAPPLIADAPCPFGPKLDGAAKKSKHLGKAYSRIAKERRILFFDASTLVVCPPTDCIHMDGYGHGLLGKALASVITKLSSKFRAAESSKRADRSSPK